MTPLLPSTIERLTAVQATWQVTLDGSADRVIYDGLVRGVIALSHEEEACRNGRQASAVHNMLITTDQLAMLSEWLPASMPNKLAKHYQRYLSKLHDRLAALDELDQVITYLLHYGYTQDRRMTVAGTLAQLDAQRLVCRNRLFDYFDGDKYHALLEGLTDWLDQQTSVAPNSLSLRLQLPLWLVSGMTRLLRYDALVQVGSPIPYNELVVSLSHYRFLLQLARTVTDNNLHTHQQIVESVLDSVMLVCQMISMRSKLIHLSVSMLEESQVNTLKQVRQQVRVEQDRRETDLIQRWQALDLRQLYHELLQAMTDLLA